MKAPQLIQNETQRLTAEIAKGTLTKHEAQARLREVIEQDPVYAHAALAEHAGRLLAAWLRTHPPAPDPLQTELFPDLPAQLYIRPGEPVDPMDCTRYGLEMARNMLFARTANQVQGATEAAQRERQAFMKLYELVTPHMANDPQVTVAQVLAKIRPGDAGASGVA